MKCTSLTNRHQRPVGQWGDMFVLGHLWDRQLFGAFEWFQNQKLSDAFSNLFLSKKTLKPTLRTHM